MRSFLSCVEVHSIKLNVEHWLTHSDHILHFVNTATLLGYIYMYPYSLPLFVCM